MSRNWPFRGLLVAASLSLSLVAHADLYTADAAYRAKDFPKAFELYRELAELGRVEAQETLAIMYVSGEGVPRSNFLGFAWASLVLEQQPSETAQAILDQLRPHLSDAGRKTAEELRAKFGKDALQEKIIPVFSANPTPSPAVSVCKMLRAGNPGDYYPREAVAKSISGFAIIDARVFSDGHDHDPHPLRLIPAQPFDAAAMMLSLYNTYAPKIVGGIAQSCTMRYKVKFSIKSGSDSPPAVAVDDAVKKRAEAGDPDSQLLYGLMLRNQFKPPSDADSSVPWYIKAAQAGNAFAQYLLGDVQLSGSILASNDAKAVFWLDKAANAGDSDAQLTLANYLLRDMSNSENVRRAVQLLGRAVDADRVDARFYLSALLASNPDPSIRDPKRALTLMDITRTIYNMNPISYEIRAAAHAWLGEYGDARNDQKHAVIMATRFHWNTKPQEDRLAAYEEGKTWTGDLLAFY
jgi:TPR repeat protein